MKYKKAAKNSLNCVKLAQLPHTSGLRSTGYPVK